VSCPRPHHVGFQSPRGPIAPFMNCRRSVTPGLELSYTAGAALSGCLPCSHNENSFCSASSAFGAHVRRRLLHVHHLVREVQAPWSAVLGARPRVDVGQCPGQVRHVVRRVGADMSRVLPLVPHRDGAIYFMIF
jgi:hypothetical protein